jgi:site-specific DNA recombinase
VQLRGERTSAGGAPRRCSVVGTYVNRTLDVSGYRVQYDDMVKARRLRPGPANRAVAYLRASKEEQELSHDAQRAAITAWAKRSGVAIVSWHEDTLTSVTPVDERPGLLAALRSVRESRAGALVVLRRDRLARDVVLSAMVESLVGAAGANVVSTVGEGNGDGPGEQLMRTMVDAFAAYERALIRSRTRAALGVKRARGERISRHAPYGFRLAGDGVHLEPNPAEQSIVSKARELRTSGMTYEAIVDELEVLGMHNRAGKRFGLETVHRMVNERLEA